MIDCTQASYRVTGLRMICFAERTSKITIWSRGRRRSFFANFRS